MNPLSARERFNISRIAIAYPWLTIAFWVAVAIAGIFVLRTLRYSLLPDITIPVVVVNAGGPMSDVSETPDQLSRPIEARLKSLETLNEVRASVTLSPIGGNQPREQRRKRPSLGRMQGMRGATSDGCVAVFDLRDGPVWRLSPH